MLLFFKDKSLRYNKTFDIAIVIFDIIIIAKLLPIHVTRRSRQNLNFLDGDNSTKTYESEPFIFEKKVCIHPGVNILSS